MRAKYYLYLSLLLWVFSLRSAGCNCSKGDPCEYDGKCGLVYIKGVFSNTSDTMHVGDSLILEVTIPDYYWVISGGDTSLAPISAFKEQAIDFGLQIIDTSNSNKIDYIKGIVLAGREGIDVFTTVYPYRCKMLYILKKKGIYFFQTASDNGCNINGSVYWTRVILEWDVPYKNFELLRPLGDERVESAIQSDAGDHYNYFPFVVVEK